MHPAGDYYVIKGNSQSRIKVLKLMSILTGLPTVIIEASKINPSSFSMPILICNDKTINENILKLGLDSKQTLKDIINVNKSEIMTEESLIKSIAPIKSIRYLFMSLLKLIQRFRTYKKFIIFIDDYYDNQSNVIQSRLWNLLELKPSEVYFIVGSDKIKPASNEFFRLLTISDTK